MLAPAKVRCIICKLIFCCANCRRRHENTEHSLTYDCPICRGERFLCRPEDINDDFIQHLADNHMPLQCRKCDKIFNKMEDMINIDRCLTTSENSVKGNDTEVIDGNGIDTSTSINKSNKTAVITPVIRLQRLVDYDLSETETEGSRIDDTSIPYSKEFPKTPLPMKKQRAVTPHVRKYITLMRQKAVDEYEEILEKMNGSPSGIGVLEESERQNFSQKEATTPTSQLPYMLKLAQAVTTSTPTHPAAAGWTLFDEQGADSPLSEIEATESPAQSVDKDSKTESENLQPKLKSIIVTESRIRLGSQDSSDKPVALLDTENSNETSVKIKKVKFAQDTVFDPEPKVKRVYRKPKRMLTPGPQKPRFCYNPHFQALVNRFEPPTRTPVNCKDEADACTPPVGDHGVHARAIDFREESCAEDETHSRESNDLYSTCVSSPGAPLRAALSAVTANIAGTLETCIDTVLRTTEEETEIEFKFVIKKKKVSVKAIAEGPQDAEEGKENIDKEAAENRENLWSSVAKAVKSVIWGKQVCQTPHRPLESDESSAWSANKRKYEEMTEHEHSPHDYKRHKYAGRIRGRPPLRRASTYTLAGLVDSDD
ncbi:uncharacterized protein fs(1)Ya [Battus philenor]|uniref:uncharacterized protein fs(1)Ya n=1 Tax=Battus philenor TaxID=42288 RepID=UPI0035D0C720